MSHEKKSIFLSATSEARKSSDLAYDRQEQINLRQREVVEGLKPLFLDLIDEIPDPFRVSDIRFDNCIIFRIMQPDIPNEYFSEKGVYWEVGVYPFGLPGDELLLPRMNATGSACQLRILFVSSSGVERLWSDDAGSSSEAFELVSQKLGEIIGREISYLNRR